MPISFVSNSVNSATDGASVTITAALMRDGASVITPPIEGDLVILAVNESSDGDVAMSMSSAGWTKIFESYSDGINADVNLAAYYKFMGASPDATYVHNGNGGSSDGLAAVAFAFRGVNPSQPFDVTFNAGSHVNNTSGTTGPDAPAITPSSTGAWIVVIGAESGDLAVALSNPGDLSTESRHFRGTSRSETNDASVAIGFKTDWVSGSFDPMAWGGGATDEAGASQSAAVLVLKPADSDYTTSADSGSFALTGTDASFRKDHRIAANSGGFTLTGVAASLGSQLTIAADPGSFVLTGTAATFTAGRAVVAEPGAFTLTGAAASLTAGYKLVAEVGEFDFSGEGADLYKGLRVSLDPGAFTFTGSPASFTIAPFVTSWSPTPPPPTGWSGDDPDDSEWDDGTTAPPSWDAGTLSAGIFDEAIFDPAIFDTGDIATWSEATPPVTAWS